MRRFFASVIIAVVTASLVTFGGTAYAADVVDPPGPETGVCVDSYTYDVLATEYGSLKAVHTTLEGELISEQRQHAMTQAREEQLERENSRLWRTVNRQDRRNAYLNRQVARLKAELKAARNER